MPLHRFPTRAPPCLEGGVNPGRRPSRRDTKRSGVGLTPPAAPSPPQGVSHRRAGPFGAGAGRSRYGLAALRAEVADVRAAPVGERNNRLNRAAFSLGMLAAGGELDRALVEEELLAAAAAVGLAETEAAASVRSGLNAGAREPRRHAPAPQQRTGGRAR